MEWDSDLRAVSYKGQLFAVEELVLLFRPLLAVNRDASRLIELDLAVLQALVNGSSQLAVKLRGQQQLLILDAKD